MAWTTPVSALVVVARPTGAVHAAVDGVRREIGRRFGVSVATGVAATRLAADVAARLVRPSGLLHVLPGYEARMLARLGVQWLDGVDADLQARLARAGVTTIGELDALDETRVWQAAGGVGIVLRRLARGDDPRPAPQPIPPRALTETIVLDRCETVRSAQVEEALATLAGMPAASVAP